MRKQPSLWKRNETILIPKKQSGLDDASNWRPITLSVMFVRLLHKILAARLSKSINLNLRQKSFIPVEGCAENILLLDTMIQRARKQHKNLNIVGIDLSKAFDTVPVHSIRRALLRHNVDQKVIDYIIDTYSDATTNVSCGPNVVKNVKISRGVKQGDPLSPILFNLVLDELLDSLPDFVGALLENTRVNSLASNLP